MNIAYAICCIAFALVVLFVALLGILSISNEELADNLIAWLGNCFHMRAIKKTEANGYNVEGFPIISFENFERIYYVSPKKWKIKKERGFYKNFGFDVWIVRKYDQKEDRWFNFGISCTENRKIKNFYKEVNNTKDKRAVLKIQQKNNKIYQEFLESVQRDIYEVRRKTSEQIKESSNCYKKVMARLANNNDV